MCRGCRDGKCVDVPTEIEPLLVSCPACNSLGCDRCRKSGDIRITECPQQRLGYEVSELLTLAKFAEKGSLPVAGGVLDQAPKFNQAVTYLWSEQARIRNELHIPAES